MSHPLSHAPTALGAAASGMLPDVDVEEARESLRSIQAALVGLGYRLTEHHDAAGAIDGVWGPLTRDAVLQFQRDNALSESGQLDDACFEAIVQAYEEGVAIERLAPTRDDDAALCADEFLRRSDHESLSDQLGEPLDEAFDEL